MIAGKEGLERPIHIPEIERPGLSLTGYLKALDGKECLRRLKPLLTPKTPALIVAHRLTPPQEMVTLCEERNIPLLSAATTTMSLQSRLMLSLSEQFAPTICCHGSLVEVFGVGILIQGDSAIGKSEAALGLIERGHCLISDDIVRIKKKDNDQLEGFGEEISRNYIEVRGIGIINVANLYGVICVKEKKSLDIVVKLEVWDDTHFYDRAGLEEKTIPILGIEVPHHILPVKPGRDVVLLLETIALNYRLKKIGKYSAREFDNKLMKAMGCRKKGS